VRWDFVNQWLAKSEEDLLVSGIILGAEMTSYDTAGFHAQQAAEKAFKALLVRHQVDFRHTHEIQELLALAEPVAPGIQAHLAAADTLTPYAVNARYPGSQPPLDKGEATRQVEVARAVVAHVSSLLQPYLNAGPPAG
jgi:HEPN domain-containing protein